MAEGLTDILEAIDQQTGGDRLSAGDIVAAFEHRGFGPLLLAPALIVLLPTGGIPGVPTVVGLLIVLIAGQMVAGRSEPWLPRKLREASIEGAKYRKVYKKVAPATRAIDHILRARLTMLVSPPAPRLIAILCILLALTMPPLEFTPFLGAVPALVITLLGLGLTARDGFVVAVALAFLLAGLVLGPIWML